MTPLGAVSAGMACPACGVGTPAGARFCPSCGQRLLGGADERRVVTVLFADLVDSTSLAETLDPEAARDLLNETFRRLAAEVRRFGGTLEQYIGDAILAVFGFPTGHDGDAGRAVRAALALRDIVKTAETALGDIALQLRIGLDTGEVAAGPWSGDLRVTGPAVHTAARIQQAAEPDQILMSVRTLRAARDIVEVGPAELLGLRGQRQPVEVVEVLALSPAEPVVDPMVDRELDLPRLIGALDHAAHHNRLVLLVGEAGVGKSTLAEAAALELGDRVHVLWGRCLPDWQKLAAASGDQAAAVVLLERSLAGLEATGHRLDQLHTLIELAPALRRVGRADDADAVAKQALDQATLMGANALVHRLTGTGPGAWGIGPQLDGQPADRSVGHRSDGRAQR